MPTFEFWDENELEAERGVREPRGVDGACLFGAGGAVEFELWTWSGGNGRLLLPRELLRGRDAGVDVDGALLITEACSGIEVECCKGLLIGANSGGGGC